MHNHNITAPQRVLYVSGMLLSMQNILDTQGNHIQDGLVPDDLKAIGIEHFINVKTNVLETLKQFNQLLSI